MDLQLEDKTILITGASGGIGRAMAEAFAAEGARLVLHGHRAIADLEAWLGQQAWSERALVVSAEIGSQEQVAAALDAGRRHFGRIDVAVANAGVWPAEDRPLWELEPERLRRTLEVNLLGAVWTAREFLRGLAEDGPRGDGHGACLLFTGSTAGEFGERDHADYATSKAALVGLMRTLKNEIVRLDPWGRVNLIQPGWTVTEMARKSLDEPGVAQRVVRTMPLRQIGRAADVARTAVFLASPFAARHLSGQTITVAGGMEGRVLWEAEEVDRDEVLRRLEAD